MQKSKIALAIASTLSLPAYALDRFTKINAQGTALPAAATGHQCVYDDTTDLLWEVKTDDGGLRDKDWTYTWYDSNSTDGNLGTSSGTTNCYQTGRCDTEKFAADVNAAGGLCGITSGWIIPTKDQLFSLVDTRFSPTINTNYFPNTQSSWFWTATPYFSNCCSWVVYFYDGSVDGSYRNSNDFVRCVRAGHSDFFSFSLSINRLGAGLGTITSSPAVINCGTGCSANFLGLNSTVKVNLTATPAAGSTFAGWSSNCANGQVNMTANTTCTATFNLIPYAPVASTDAPSLINLNRVTLKGTVNPKGAVTAASFDYGSTTAYGTNIVATPSSIAATAAVTSVSTTATFDCNKTYHYRTKAVNSVGTAYGADKTFSTTCPASSTKLTNGTALANQTITAGEWKYYYLSVPSGADTLKFVTTGSGDIDLYAQANALPTADVFTCNSETAASNETCTPATATAGTWWLGVFAYEDSTFSVTGSFRRPQTIGAITFNPTTVTVGTATASATASSGLAVTFTSTTPTICTATGTNGKTIKAAHIGTCTIKANQAGNTIYSAAPAVTKTVTVGKGSQTITLTCNPSSLAMGATTNCTATASSGLTTTLRSTTPSVCSLTGNTVKGVTVGTCIIAANQTGNADYSAAPQVTSNITVTKANQTITLTCTPLNITVGGTATCTATATSGLTVSLSAVDTTICSIAAGKVTGLKAGTCAIKAKQAGSANYNPATPVTKNIVVGG